MSKIILDEISTTVPGEAGKRKLVARPGGFREIDPDGNETLISGTAAVAAHKSEPDPHPDKVDKVEGKGLSTEDYSTLEKTKLAGIASGATANDTDANLKNRASHTGTQAIGTVTGLQDALDAKADLVEGKIPATQLPSYVDDILEFADFASLPATGESGKIYVLATAHTSDGVTSSQFRWSGTAYAPIIASPGSTDAVTEGAGNLYFTYQRVRDTVLTGLSTATNAVIAATDSVLSALGKLQKQISDHFVAADPHTQYAKKAGADFTGPVSVDGLITAKSSLKFDGAGEGPYWGGGGTAITGDDTGGAQKIDCTIGGSLAARLTSAGIQGAIGQTTPAAAAFTQALINTASNPNGYKLRVEGGAHVSMGANNNLEVLSPNSGTGTRLFARNDAGALNRLELQGSHVVMPLNSGVDGLVFDAASGNLGLGVTPSAWGGTYKALQLAGGTVNSFSNISMSVNQGTYDAGIGDWRCLNTGLASARYEQVSGAHYWLVAPGGTAGAPITWTQAMTLDAGGNLSAPAGINNTPIGQDAQAAGSFTTLTAAGAQIRSTAATANLQLINDQADNVTVNTTFNSLDFVASSGAAKAASIKGRVGEFSDQVGLSLWTSAGGTDYAERAQLTPAGNWLVGVVGGTNHVIARTVAENENVLSVYGIGGDGITVRRGNSSAYSGAGAALFVAANSVTSRSANLSGTLNASGADYAEYMRKAATCGTIAKGQIVGVNADGELTDQWVAAVSFLIKSTDPSYVGGDTFGTEESLGMKRPVEPIREEDDTDETFTAKQQAYVEARQTFDAALEAARQKVDRIAFSGQVPVNVQGAVPGQYVVPVQDGEGIGGMLVNDADITFEQYRRAVGIVQNILSDGRANVRVKVC